MDEKDYFELARFVRSHFIELGLNDLADFSHYMVENGEEQVMPDGRMLVRLMFMAFDRHLAVNSSETLERSMQKIAENIDSGKIPRDVFLHRDDGVARTIGRVEAESLNPEANLSEIRIALWELQRRLFAGDEPPIPDEEVQ